MEPTDTWITSHQVRLTGIRGRNMYYESTKIALFNLGWCHFMDGSYHNNTIYIKIEWGNSVQNSLSTIKDYKHLLWLGLGCI